jgi:CheY-like chemotaxis protein
MHILVAEDDKVSRELLRRILESDQKHAIDLTVDGTEAWAKLEDPALAFDACILDIQMPGIDGLELASRIRSTDRIARTPIILCTAANDRPTVERAAHLAVSGYIVKPYTRERVLASIQRVASAKPAPSSQAAPKPAPKPPAVEKSEVVCKRLGIDAATHATLLDGTLRDLREWLAQLRSAAPGADPAQLTVRADGLKGACLSLGAPSLARYLVGLKPHLSPPDPAKLEPVLAEFEKAIAEVADLIGVAKAA